MSATIIACGAHVNVGSTNLSLLSIYPVLYDSRRREAPETVNLAAGATAMIATLLTIPVTFGQLSTILVVQFVLRDWAFH
jgi:hypothetical protein